MAKNTKQDTEQNTGETVLNETAAAAADDGTVVIKIPLTRTEKDDVYVALNGRAYLIKRGEAVRVPEGVAEILQHSEEMLREAIDFETSHQSKD